MKLGGNSFLSYDPILVRNAPDFLRVGPQNMSLECFFHSVHGGGEAGG